jgi:glycosyltransferase involved in cell wall biosynthesis
MFTKRCIIIPAYNEEQNIAAVILDIKKYSENDIVIIDDGSTDSTVEIERREGVFVIRHPFNMGFAPIVSMKN